MFRNALAAALRHLSGDRWYAAIAVLGLAVGLCTALLAALYIRSQFTFEHFVGGHEDVYVATTISPTEGGRTYYSTQTPQLLAALMKQRFTEVDSVARMTTQMMTLRVGDPASGGYEGRSSLIAVDANFFATVPVPVVAGDPVAALAEPDQVVLTRGLARRLFGEDVPLGRTLQADSGGPARTLTVGAVLEDVPTYGSRLFQESGVFVSGQSAWTGLARMDNPPPDLPAALQRGYVTTLVRLTPGAAPQPLHAGLPELMSRLPGMSEGERLDLLPIDRIQTNSDYNPAIDTTIVWISALALMILLVVAVNFVNLLTARSGARALEIGVRKLAGASRGTLALQFIGETFLYVAIAVLVAMAMTELLLPRVSAAMQASTQFDYWTEPALLGWLLVATALFAVLTGLWPAMVLSGMQPLGAMQGARLARGRGGLVRQGLVVVQFALPAALLLQVGMTYLQVRYEMERVMRFDVDQVVILDTSCSPARMTELRRIPGVVDAACSGSQLLGGEGTGNGVQIQTRDGRKVPMAGVWIDESMLQLYGVKLLAGRGLTAADYEYGFPGRHSTRVVINDSAVRALGFSSAAAAIGPYPLMPDTDALRNGRPAGEGLAEIIGVVPDFSMAKWGGRIAPTVYYADPIQFSTISVKLKGGDIPATLAEIDRVWKNTRGKGGEAPVGRLNRMFYDERVERMYVPVMFEARIFTVAASVAMALALLGLLGLAASVARQRTKEIGIRKALGASTGDVLRLLLWQFIRPVVWANLIVWPLMAWKMHHGLVAMVERIDPPLWLFPATMLVTVVIALATVTAHTLRVARAKPVAALRYE